MFWISQNTRKSVTLCMSIDAAQIAKKSIRKRLGTGRRALSLAAVHEPPDRLSDEHLGMTSRAAVKSGPVICLAVSHRRRRRDYRH